MAPDEPTGEEPPDPDEAGETAPEEPHVLLLDETENGFGAGEDSDAGETGDDVLGEVGDAVWEEDDRGPQLGTPRSDTAADRVPLSAEEAAVHLMEEEGDRDAEDDAGGPV